MASTAANRSDLLATWAAAHPGLGAVGIDVADVGRLRRLVERWGDQVLRHLFTGEERASLRGRRGLRWQSVAGRFAAKEAVRKVLASRGRVSSWTEVEVLSGEHGQPFVVLHGRARTAAEQCGFNAFLLSISHERGVAVAIALAVRCELPEAAD